MMNLRKTFGQSILNQRKIKQITQQKLAYLSCISVSHLRNIEHGTGNATLEIVERIANSLGTEIYLLMQSEAVCRLPENIRESPRENIPVLPCQIQQRGEICLYCISKGDYSKNDACYIGYGIRFEDTEIEDITTDYASLLELVNACNELELDPIHIYEVLDNFLALS